MITADSLGSDRERRGSAGLPVSATAIERVSNDRRSWIAHQMRMHYGTAHQIETRKSELHLRDWQ